MDDLYSNLENYDDVNAIDELRNENRELKHKLEECSKTMNQLQKDFDKLSNEYKKLETNYSSLLKTAKAEIERKTQLITNLNKEKDMIVIRAMQGGCRNVLNVNKSVHNYKKCDAFIKHEENKDMLNKTKPGVSGNFRDGSRESPLLLMKDNTTVPATTRSTSSEQNLPLDDSHSKQNNMLNNSEIKKECDKPKTAKISNRRKSMPVLSNREEQTFSEEDEMQGNYENTRNVNKYKDYDNLKPNSQYLESKGGHKNNRSEQFIEESKLAYNKGLDRYNSHFDRRTSYNQSYDNYSPERGGQRQHREINYSSRSDYYRHRVLESPPKDKYNTSKSWERRQRERDNRREFDYYNSRYEDNYDARSNIRGPDLKRRKIDLSSTDRERPQVERRSYRISEYRHDVTSDNLMSCQSPDDDQIDPNNQHLVKEIKNTATIQLEDPRKNNKKYLLKESDKGTFITTVHKNICLLPVDKKRWGFETVEVPETLKANIWEESAKEDIENFIYLDIDNPAKVPSSETCKNSTYSSINRSDTSGDPEDVNRKECSPLDKTEQKLQKKNIVSETIMSGYKIPKKSRVCLKSNNTVQENVNKNKSNNGNKKLSLNENNSLLNNFENKIGKDSNKLKTQQLTPVEHNIEGDLELSDKASDVTDELQITLKPNDKLTPVSIEDGGRNFGNDGKGNKKDDIIDKVQKMDTIDMKNNNGITVKNIMMDLAHTIEKEENIHINVDSAKASKDSLTKKSETSKKKTSKKKCNEKSPENKDIKIVDKTKESSRIEPKETKKREKRKKLTSSESEKEKKEITLVTTADNMPENKPKEFKSQNKFTELFGESSSLITPEDLNIPTKFDISLECNENYGSLFENTQDAIDLNVREITKASKTGDSDLKVLKIFETLSKVEYAPNTIDEKSISEIETAQVIDNTFKNLKPAFIDDESNIVKTVVISSGTQPCSQEYNKNHINTAEMENSAVKGTGKIVKHPLKSLRAVATSTPNRMQLEELSTATVSVSPNSINNDDNISHSASLTTATTVEANSDVPDVRIFIKRRRKIKKT